MEENVKNMKLRYLELRSLNILSGKIPASVNVQTDGCYNNALYSGVGKTHFRQAHKLYIWLQKMRHQNINVQTKLKLFSKCKHGSNSECQHELTVLGFNDT